MGWALREAGAERAAATAALFSGAPHALSARLCGDSRLVSPVSPSRSPPLPSPSASLSRAHDTPTSLRRSLRLHGRARAASPWGPSRDLGGPGSIRDAPLSSFPRLFLVLWPDGVGDVVYATEALRDRVWGVCRAMYAARTHASSTLNFCSSGTRPEAHHARKAAPEKQKSYKTLRKKSTETPRQL